MIARRTLPRWARAFGEIVRRSSDGARASHRNETRLLNLSRALQINSGTSGSLSTNSQKPSIYAVGAIGMRWMPLRRGQILRYDADRMAFEFTLLDSEGGTVRFQIAATPASSTWRDSASAYRPRWYLSGGEISNLPASDCSPPISLSQRHRADLRKNMLCTACRASAASYRPSRSNTALS
jgi:hypothetical protein